MVLFSIKTSKQWGILTMHLVKYVLLVNRYDFIKEIVPQMLIKIYLIQEGSLQIFHMN